VEAARLASAADATLPLAVAPAAAPAVNGGPVSAAPAGLAPVTPKLEAVPIAHPAASTVAEASRTAARPVEPAVESARALAADEARRQAPKASKV